MRRWRRLRGELHDYFADFDARDAGKLLPDIVGAVLSGGGSASLKGAQFLDDATRIAKTAANSTRRTMRLVREKATRVVRRGGKEGTRCFVAGTLVLTASGMTPIEDIAPGDIVYSRDDATGEESYQPVLQTFVTPDMAVWDVEFTEADGSTETISATYGHPFWVAGQGWTDTEALEPGMEVETAGGGVATVSGLALADERATVYNFEVDVTHTYFVGQAGVWVHNTSICPIYYKPLDELGRPTGVVANISKKMLGTGSEASQSIQPPGFITGIGSNRARGHLLANLLGGSGKEVRNLVTIVQNPTNGRIMKKLESIVANAVRNGETVRYTATPIYNYTSRIPRAITIRAQGSDGLDITVSILNPTG